MPLGYTCKKGCTCAGVKHRPDNEIRDCSTGARLQEWCHVAGCAEWMDCSFWAILEVSGGQ